MEEASNNGKLVRMYHEQPPVPISRMEGSQYFVKRLPSSSAISPSYVTIQCPSAFVSRTHCEIFRRNKAFWIRDHKSSNGTFVNALKLTPEVERELRFGDVIGMGISNEQDDSAIEPNDERAFIYRFIKEQDQVELVDLENEDDLEILEEIQNTSDSSSSSLSSSLKRHVKTSVPIAATTPKGRNETPVKTAEKISASSTKRKAPVVSPQQPPPDVSQPSSSEKVSGRTSTKENQGSASKAKKENANPLASKKDEKKKTVAKSEKRQLPKQHNQQPSKRFKLDEKESDSSNDDSSDGMEEIKDKRSKKEQKDERRKETFEWLMNERNDPDDEDELVDVERSPEASSFPQSTRIASKSSSRGSTRPSSAESDVMDVDLVGEIEDSFRKKKQRKYSDLIRDASKDTCQVELQPAIILNDGKYEISRNLLNTLNAVTQERIGRQFRQSFLRNNGRSGVGLLLDTRRKVELANVSDHEDLSSDQDEPVGTSKNDTFEVQKGSGNVEDTPSVHLTPNSNKKPETPASSSAKTQPRRTLMLSNAPAPRHALKAQQKYAAFKSPIPPGLKVPKTSPQQAGPSNPPVPITPDEKRNMIKEKLREIELAKPKEDVSKTTPKPKTTPKVKVTTRNRNEAMLETIISSKPDGNARNESTGVTSVKTITQLEGRSTNDETTSFSKHVSNTSSKESESPTAALHTRPVLWPGNAETSSIIGSGKAVSTEFTKNHISTAASTVPPFTSIQKVQTSLNSVQKPVQSTKMVPRSIEHGKDIPPVGLRDPRQLAKPRNPVIQPPQASTSNMPQSRVNGFQSTLRGNQQQEYARKIDPPINQHPPHANAQRPGPSVLKPGAAPLLSPTNSIGNVRSYKEPAAPAANRQLKPHKYSSVVSDEEIYKRILRWNGNWLEEQKKFRENNVIADPELIKDNETLMMTLVSYENYEAYFKIYFPLLLYEIWACIGNDNNNRSQTKKSCYNLRIVNVVPSVRCRLVREAHSSPEILEDDASNWLYITYHTWVKTRGEIDVSRNLVVIQLQGMEKDKGNPAIKSLLGLSCQGSDKYEPASKDNCDGRLKGKGSEPGYRFEETIMCRFAANHKIDKHALAQITRVCNITPKLREFNALNSLPKSSLAEKIITPTDEPRYHWSAYISQKHSYSELITPCQRLNVEQIAVVKLVSTRVESEEPELMFMHGPPGTGKTKTIVSLVLQLIFTHQKRHPAKNHRILICTPSNAAVDEIMRRLECAIAGLPQAGKPIQMIRIGEGYHHDLKKYNIDSKVQAAEHAKSTTKSIKAELTATENDIEELLKEIMEMKKSQANPISIQGKQNALQDVERRRETLKKDYNNILNKDKTPNEAKRVSAIANSQIVCATLCSSNTSNLKSFVNKLPPNEKPFLCCIVDEASQTTELETLLPLTLNVDKMLLVGDPFQLGATVRSLKAEEKNYGQSLFKRHFDFHKRSKKGNPVMSLVHQYRMHEQIANWPNIYFYEEKLKTIYNAPHPHYPLRPYLFLNLSSSREHSEKEGQIQNADEVVLVKAMVDTIDDMLAPLGKKWTIGVITPYSAQKFTLRNEFETKKDFKSFKSVDIESVDGFQGQEKDIIIISCVRTDATGFLKNPNRLNVALTRAKHSLYIIGDTGCLSQVPMWKCLIQEAAAKNNKYNVNPDFKVDIKLLKSQLRNQLSNSGNG